MLDELLDIFDRDRKDQRRAPKQGGIRGLLGRLTGNDDRSDDRDRRRYDDDDRRRPRREREGFELFDD